MRTLSYLVGSILATAALQSAHADIELIAIGTLSGTYEDLAHNTSAALESGARGNRLGGLGSGLAYAGGSSFIALPDRGPNATPYNSSLDDTTSYIERFHTFDLSLAPSESGAALPFTLTPTLRATTLLWNRTALTYASGGAPALNAAHRRYYFSGRSDNFDPDRSSLNSNNGRLDSEGVRVSRDGRTIFVTDEYGPYVYQFDRVTGVRLRAYKLPEKFGISHLSSVGNTEISGNTTGRVANKGMEGLAITPDGRTLIGIMQSPLLQDGGTDGATTRIVTIDVTSGAIREFAYPLTNIGTASKPKYPTVSEIVAVNNHQLLVDERDGKGLGDNSTAASKQLWLIDLANAAEVSGISGAANLAAKAVSKTLFLDLVTALKGAGFNANDIPAKLEGLTFGQDVTVNGKTRHTLFVANDNDFLSSVVDTNHPTGIDNPNKWFVFAFDDADLPNFTQQSFLKPFGFDDDEEHGW